MAVSSKPQSQRQPFLVRAGLGEVDLLLSKLAKTRIPHRQNVLPSGSLICWDDLLHDDLICDSNACYCCRFVCLCQSMSLCAIACPWLFMSTRLSIAGRLCRYLPGLHVCVSVRVSMFMNRCFRGFRCIDVTKKPFRALNLSRANAR